MNKKWWAKMKGIEFLLLGLGAPAGAFLRYKIAESPTLLRVLPINILIINVIGSFMLGMFVVIFAFQISIQSILYL
ncbi:MAG: CrcB family protein [Nitrososphaeraceae archaeon]|nr:CrcB family protein [Nitrososphaeraceae archaeon]